MIMLILDGSRLFSPGWRKGTKYSSHSQGAEVLFKNWFNLIVYLLFSTNLLHLSKAERDHLEILFENYIESALSFKKTICKELISITELNGVTSLCRLYDSLATPSSGVWRAYWKFNILETDSFKFPCDKCNFFPPSLLFLFRLIPQTPKTWEGLWSSGSSSASSGPSVPRLMRKVVWKWATSYERGTSRSLPRCVGNRSICWHDNWIFVYLSCITLAWVNIGLVLALLLLVV